MACLFKPLNFLSSSTGGLRCVAYAAEPFMRLMELRELNARTCAIVTGTVVSGMTTIYALRCGLSGVLSPLRAHVPGSLNILLALYVVVSMEQPLSLNRAWSVLRNKCKLSRTSSVLGSSMEYMT